jgi:hypothetical protein
VGGRGLEVLSSWIKAPSPRPGAARRYPSRCLLSSFRPRQAYPSMGAHEFPTRNADPADHGSGKHRGEAVELARLPGKPVKHGCYEGQRADFGTAGSARTGVPTSAKTRAPGERRSDKSAIGSPGATMRALGSRFLTGLQSRPG